jgi:rhodanese-related sulfurtransferase
MTGMAEHEVPGKKQTVLGLYVTAREAYKMWEADPGGVKIVDVRTPEEYIFVGHPAMAKNIPLLFIKYAWDVEKNQPVVAPNPDFAPAVMKAFASGDTLLMMCRSGGRSALAANGLAKAGFTNVYNIIDGFEGDKVDDPASAYHGKRMMNGWKNSGAPWTYDVDLKLAWLSQPT